MRGKGKSLKRYLRKKRKNVIDPRSMSAREHLAKQRAEREQGRETAGYKPKSGLPSALDRFCRR
jgi:U3 small nucleolar RNA-associated protein 7